METYGAVSNEEAIDDKRKFLSGRKPKYPEIEKELLELIQKLRKEKKQVSYLFVKEEAKEIAKMKKLNEFTCSVG